MLRNKNGERHEFKANVQPTKITTDQADLPVEEGDFIERSLPNGMLETYLVSDRGFHAAFHGIPAHYQMKVRKESAIDSAQKSAAQIYTISGSPNARITIQPTDNSVNVHSVTEQQLFLDMANAVKEQVPEETRRAEMLAALRRPSTRKYKRILRAKISATHVHRGRPHNSAYAFSTCIRGNGGQFDEIAETALCRAGLFPSITGAYTYEPRAESYCYFGSVVYCESAHRACDASKR